MVLEHRGPTQGQILLFVMWIMRRNHRISWNSIFDGKFWNFQSAVNPPSADSRRFQKQNVCDVFRDDSDPREWPPVYCVDIMTYIRRPNHRISWNPIFHGKFWNFQSAVKPPAIRRRRVQKRNIYDVFEGDSDAREDPPMCNLGIMCLWTRSHLESIADTIFRQVERHQQTMFVWNKQTSSVCLEPESVLLFGLGNFAVSDTFTCDGWRTREDVIVGFVSKTHGKYDVIISFPAILFLF